MALGILGAMGSSRIPSITYLRVSYHSTEEYGLCGEPCRLRRAPVNKGSEI